ncbi:thiopurine S-methyltransferase [Nitrosospira briensis]|uniref:thiopurine S-methyltransferase n=1 Tax=Nitrosospira briensis TaxID=35799 RepID=UPI00046A4051|nr:thiopurine S-methyltransferase [Nitrosospira briensis]
MEKDYWLERWKREETGFHQNEVNPYLCQYWQALHLAADSEVFVPLCGKSRDMLWLSEQGYAVLGVETSAVAVQAFFKENGYIPNQTSGESFDRYDASGVRILCGDFFDLSKHDLAKTNAVYDRASLIALPPEMRERYAGHLLSILPPAAQILLITLDYPQQEMAGPPFAVSANEVEALYHERFTIRLLSQLDVLAQEPRFEERGLNRLQESIFLLAPHR